MKIAWVCSTAWRHEVGHTDVRIYPSLDALKQGEACIDAPDGQCEPTLIMLVEDPDKISLNTEAPEDVPTAI